MTLKEVYERAQTWVEARKDQLTEDLRELVRVPSVKGEPEPGAPYGRECARALEVTKQIFASHGIDSKIWPEGGYLIAEVGKGERCFAMVSHSDVVAVDDNWTLCQPFEPLVKDGFMVGRGTSDNKDSIVSTLYATLALRELGIPMNSRIRLVVGSAEESTMPDMRNFAREQPMPDVSLVPDMRYPVGRGEKGILRFWAVSDDKLTSIRDFHGGTAPNVILGKATVRFAWTPELEKALGAPGGRRGGTRPRRSAPARPPASRRGTSWR